MTESDGPQSGYFIRHQCETCGAELRQYFKEPSEAAQPVGEAHPHSDCPECAFGDVWCASCGDSLCPQHTRSLSRYENYMDPEMFADLQARYGGQVFCPLCFQNMLRTPPSRRDRKPRNLFNVPLILGLCSIFLIIAIGLRSCPTTL